jgi:hypothetical protein
MIDPFIQPSLASLNAVMHRLHVLAMFFFQVVARVTGIRTPDARLDAEERPG